MKAAMTSTPKASAPKIEIADASPIVACSQTTALDARVRIELDDKEGLWRQFSQLPNEMIVTKTGRSVPDDHR